MTTTKKIAVFSLLFVSLFFVESLFAQNLACQEFEKDSILILNKKLDVKKYDKSSIVKESNISYENLKGFWQSYKGLLIIGRQYSPMNLFKPLTIEIDSNKIRHNDEDAFEFFTIKKGKIISQKKEDLGIINKITDKVLVITLINNVAMTRYYYELKE